MNNEFIKLKNLQEKIEQLSKFNQIEILKILHSSNVMINENKYGCHINLTEVSNDVIKEMDFCEKAEKMKEKERISKLKGFLIK